MRKLEINESYVASFRVTNKEVFETLMDDIVYCTPAEFGERTMSIFFRIDRKSKNVILFPLVRSFVIPKSTLFHVFSGKIKFMDCRINKIPNEGESES